MLFQMFLTRALRGNLNIPHWNRRVWEIGYSGPPLPKRKATGRPNYPISKNQVTILRDRFAREYNVMKLLTRPYVTAVSSCSSLSFYSRKCLLSTAKDPKRLYNFLFGILSSLCARFQLREAESDYFASKNVTGLDQIREQEKARAEALRMPGKAKRVDGSKRAIRRRANVGNLLQKHITVEDSLAELMNRNCWD
ncbi:unnamed protein product [Haemonchus placei]|uniref:MRP-S23 domain-containing protein n=1 Tax=Haemonchus placei TaxID=6290 RepID=A0A0N4W861_HAEPC|nr:unnamed protein product [Haemonchus placei]